MNGTISIFIHERISHSGLVSYNRKERKKWREGGRKRERWKGRKVKMTDTTIFSLRSQFIETEHA